ncbi:hypothetical protein ACRAQ6_02755 [Erythrobacter sp. HA6-11]
MRAFAAAATLSLAFTLPHAALAQEAIPDETGAEMSALVEQLSDPEQQERASDMVGSLSELMLALPIGKFINAAQEATGEEAADIAEDATVRELIGEEADELPSQISERVPQMMGLLAGLVEGLDEMRPALMELGETMRERVEESSES